VGLLYVSSNFLCLKLFDDDKFHLKWLALKQTIKYVFPLSFPFSNFTILISAHSCRTLKALKANFTSVQDKQLYKDFETALRLMPSSTAEDKKTAFAARAKVMEMYTRQLVNQEFNSDILNPVNMGEVPAPAWLSQFSQNAKVVPNGKVSIKDAQAYATSYGTKEEQAARIRELTTYYEAAVNKRNNGGTVFKVDPFEIQKVKASSVMALTGFSASFFTPNVAYEIEE
jgi:hypothetical protein